VSYRTAYLLAGSQTVYNAHRCDECHALVQTEDRHDHTEWHKRRETER
jgi:hypothetical protein